MEKKQFERMQELLEKEDIREAICECTDSEEFEALFASNGVEFEAGEAEQIYNAILEKAESEELLEDDLDMVAGGSIIGGLAVFAVGFTAAYIVGRVGWSKIKKMSKYSKKR